MNIANQSMIKPQPSTLTTNDDIRHALHSSEMFDDNSKVSAAGGKVHLTGNVESWHDRELAAATAWAAPGTTSVSNSITVARNLLLHARRISPNGRFRSFKGSLHGQLTSSVNRSRSRHLGCCGLVSGRAHGVDGGLFCRCRCLACALAHQPHHQ